MDTYRNTAGSSENIVNILQAYGLQWDNSIYWQSSNTETYHTIIAKLNEQNLVYPCVCTRKSLSGTPVYPGFCLHTKPKPESDYALRIKSKNFDIIFNDEIQGYRCHSLAAQHGDFIVKRKDKIIAYQLSVVIDDYVQNISHVIRGFDLLDSTPRQIFLQQILGYPTPNYCHMPMIIDQQGNKLSKQTFAKAVSPENPEKTLFLLLQLLKLNPPSQLKSTPVKQIINWAIENWQTHELKKIRAINQEIY